MDREIYNIINDMVEVLNASQMQISVAVTMLIIEIIFAIALFGEVHKSNAFR